jgi:hypothetical protein
MRAKIVGGALVLAVGLVAAGCAERNGTGRTAGVGDSKICTPFAQAGTTPTDPTAVGPAAGGDAAAFDDCLHRWGYRLAKSDDAADDVAVAVLAACTPVLSRWNQSTLAAQPPGTADTALSLVTGKSGNTPEDRYEMGRAKAQFYVVQGRAGNCAAP